MKIEFELNSKFIAELKNQQALLGCPDLKSTANLLVSLGTLIVNEAVANRGYPVIMNNKRNEYREIKHPALDKIRDIIDGN
ncbi:MAG: hypothetical protein KDD03_05670 [Gelidibacter sp.]|nr:hypothetical protein [Gelidibacter sp.]